MDDLDIPEDAGVEATIGEAPPPLPPEDAGVPSAPRAGSIGAAPQWDDQLTGQAPEPNYHKAAGGFEPTAAQRKLALAYQFPKGHQNSMVSPADLDKGMRDRAAQEIGMPYDPSLSQAEMAALYDRANGAVRAPASPMRDQMVARTYEHLLSIEQQKRNREMEFLMRAKEKREAAEAKAAAGPTEQQMMTHFEREYSTMDKHEKDLDKQIATALPADKPALEALRKPWHGDETAKHAKAVEMARQTLNMLRGEMPKVQAAPQPAAAAEQTQALLSAIPAIDQASRIVNAPRPGAVRGTPPPTGIGVMGKPVPAVEPTLERYQRLRKSLGLE